MVRGRLRLLPSRASSAAADAHVAIVTYWRSFEEHERSHADRTFKDKLSALAALRSDSREPGCEMLRQGSPEPG